MNRNKKIGFTFVKNELTRSLWINRFLNKLTYSGQKETTENMLYSIMLDLKKNKINLVLSLFYAFEILKPIVFVKPNAVRGKIKFVPSHIGVEEQYNRAISWLVQSIQRGDDKNFKNRVVREIFKIMLYKRSWGLKQKRRIYKTVIKNRTLINFRF